MRRVPTAVLAGWLVACGGSGASVEPGDASAPEVSAVANLPEHATSLTIARTLARPERAVVDVLRARVALHAESTGLGVTPELLGDLALHVATKATDATRIGTDDEHALTISIDGAAGSSVVADDGAAVHHDVFPATDAIWATNASRAELLFLLRDATAPSSFSLHLGKGSGLVRIERTRDGLAFHDARDVVRLRIPTPIALDAHGVRREAQMSLDDDGHTLRISLDETDLTFPVLLDPAVLQGRWTLIGEFDKRTRGSLPFDPLRGKLIAMGGYHAGSYDEPGAGAVGVSAYTTPAHTFTPLADANGVFTSAMLGGSPTFYDYGWFGAFDSTRGKLVAVGSSQYDCTAPCTTNYKMQVNEWDSATNVWKLRCTTPACAATAPGAAQGGVEVVYDVTRKYTVVCNTGSRSCAKWDGATTDGTWTALAAWPASGMGRGFYDAKYGAATFLGSDGTYSWSGTAWVKRTTSFIYPIAATYDTIRKRAIAIVGNGLNCDTYEWDGSSGAWTLVASASTSSPYAKDAIAMGFDPVAGRAVTWGGGNGQSGYYFFDFIGTLFEYQAYGNSCAGDADCSGGSCRDGFCCDTKCGACQRCDGPGAGGVCAAFSGAALGGTEHDTCTGTNACDPSGACKAKNGQTCGSGNDCASGSCVDGYCCGSACNQACEVCNATPGTCTPAAKGASGRGGCGVGTCNGALRTCSTVCTTDAECSATGWCKAGACVIGTASGSACVRDRQCLSGSCVDGVCCDATCNGACEACTKAKGATADGACTVLPATSTPLACGGYACSGTSSACAASCATDTNCASGYYCDGKFCQKVRTVGDGCARTSQCNTGLTCVDGVCCNSACDGACQACSVANKQSGDAPGVCGPAKAGSDPGDRCIKDDVATCGKSGVCGATGTCALWPKGSACGGGVSCDAGSARGQTCDGLGACLTDTTGTPCAPGICTATAGCAFICAADSDCDKTGFCDSGSCKARSLDGRTCTDGRQCASGNCIDGVCCATACNGLCEACNGVGTEGTCTLVTGPPHEGHGTCPGKKSDDACTASACDGATRDACKALAGPEVTCRAASCADALESLASKCDGSGSCPSASSRSCAPFGCSGTHCIATCTTDADCAKGNRCDVTSGKCISNGTCDGDQTIIGADGSKTACAPFKCDDKGCKTSCSSADECAAPAVCDGKVCIVPSEQSSGGCSATPGERTGSVWLLALFAAWSARRRKSATACKGAL